MFHAENINDTKKLNEEMGQYKDISVVSAVSQQQVIHNYYQVKMEVKRLIGRRSGEVEGVERAEGVLLGLFLIIKHYFRVQK